MISDETILLWNADHKIKYTIPYKRGPIIVKLFPNCGWIDKFKTI